MSSAPPASAADDAKTNARETAKNNPLENAQTLRGIYISKYEFPNWVLDKDRWNENSDDKSHKFDDTIVVYDDGSDLNQVKELVEQREPVNVCINGVMQRSYNQNELEKNFGWKTGAYGKSTSEQLYPNIGIYCHARVTNGVKSKEEKNVHVMNLIGYGFDSKEQTDYQYFLNKYDKDDKKQQFKEELIQRYRKIWLKACYICKFKGLKHLWYYGVGNGNFSGLLPPVWAGEKNFYNEIFAEAFGINPTDSSQLHSTNDGTNLDIPINFCKTNGVDVQNLGAVNTDNDTLIPQVLFNGKSDPTNTLYINAWDPWSIIGNENNAFNSLDSIWGRNSNMSVLGWSMTNSKLLPEIMGGGVTKPSKILSMREILDKIKANDAAGKAPVSGDSTPLPSTPSCNIDTSGKNITGITTECQDAIFSLVTAPVIVPPTDTDEPTEMSNLVSAIGTTYSSEYAIEGKNIKNPDDQTIMPAGSATLLYIGDTELFNVKPHSTTTKTNVKIKYMIQASPAKAGNKSDVSRDITKDTISNSVMNSLILAAKNGVETIIFPFIGGELFYGALKTKVDTKNASTSGYKEYDTDQHAEVLVKGVTDFYTNFSSYGIKSNPIKEIYFVTYNTPEKIISHKDGTSTTIPEVKEHEAIKKAYDNAKAKYLNLTSVLNQSIIGNVISNAIHYSTYPNIKPNIAIVNAANTQLQFGAGVSNMCYAGLTGNLNASDDNKSKSTYQIKLYTIKTKFIEAFTKYIANPSAASSSPPATSSKPKEDLGKVIEGLVNSIKETEDDYTKKLGINPSSGNFMYEYPPSDASSPPPPPVKEDKNLNSTQPTIEDMITAFENAEAGGETDFYLGACGSIKAAYVLEKGSNADTSNEAMRAKLLLNLRKNSLLLKVPARWDYATMKLGEVSGPPDTLDKLMKFSLQDTIEYYSEGGDATEDEKARFKELNIHKEPIMKWDIPNGLGKASIDDVDKRFCQGIESGIKESCFFLAALQYLMCNEDFLKIMIVGNCKDNFVESININSELTQAEQTTCGTTIDDDKSVLKNLLLLFKKWRSKEPFNVNRIDDASSNPLSDLYKIYGFAKGGQSDSNEVLTKISKNFECLDNPCVKKFLSNGLVYRSTQTIINPEVDGKKIDDSTTSQPEGYAPITPPGLNEYLVEQLTKGTDDASKDLIANNFEISVKDTIDSLSAENKYEYQINAQSLTGVRKEVYDNLDSMLGFNKADMSKSSSNGDGTTKTIEQTLLGSLYYPIAQIEIKKNDDFTMTQGMVDTFKSLYKKNNSIPLSGINTILSNKNLINVIQKIYNSYYSSPKPMSKPNFEASVDEIKKLIENLNDILLKLNSSIDSMTMESLHEFIVNNILDINKLINKAKTIQNIMLNPRSDAGLPLEVNSTKKCIFGKYIMIDFKRTSDESANIKGKPNAKLVYKYKININNKININFKEYVLVGFIYRSGNDSESGHFVCVKCNSQGNPIVFISDNNLYPYGATYMEYGSEWGRGVTSVIYKQEEPASLASLGGGGFKPRHNATATHTTSTSKSKHNSSFKASSSKTKGKSRNRSHTQRVK